MKVIPVGKWVHVEVIEKEESDSFVLLPEDYKTSENPYQIVTVVSDSESFSKGSKLIVPTHVIRHVTTDEGDFHLIESAHVMAELQ